jgi:hypothetical protein
MMEGCVLSDEQKHRWKEDGFLLLPGLLTPNEVRDLTAAVDAMWEAHLRQPDAKPEAGMDRRNVMEEDDRFVALMDHPATFPLVLELMGPYIQLSMSEVIVRPPNPEGSALLHTDGGQAMRQIRVTEDSLPLQIKIQYFLTDVASPDSGNFTVVPGSHRRQIPEGGVEGGPYIPEAVQLCLQAGDAAVFAHSLWHGYVKNRSEQPRKTLIYCYSQQCFRPFDYEKASPELLARCTPRQRRLIGDIGAWKPGSYFYSPADQIALITGAETAETAGH